jgi:asparagine synthase (glutamine-hydrolysing)
VRLSRRIADIAEQPHHTLRLDQSFFTGFTEIAERAVFLSDGSMDVTGSIDLYLQKKARQIAPIRISGVYGGELLRRLVVFRPMRLAGEVFSSELAHAMGNAARTYSEELSGHLLSFSLFKQAPWYMTGKFAIERSQVTFRTPYFDNDLAALAYQSPPEEQRRHDLSLHVTAGGNRRMAALRTDRGPGLYAGPVLGRIQRALGELTFKAEYAFDYGMPQRLARIDGFIRPFHLEKLFLGRHKFHHFRVWYRDRLSHNVREVLLDARTRNRPYLQPRILERMVTDHLAGRANRTLDLHRLLTLEIIERTLIEGGSSIARRESFLRGRSLTVSA